MAITDWPSDERPREKLLKFGPQTLSDAELLAIFLRTGVKGYSAVSLAQELLRQFGSLRAMLDSDSTQFCAHHGLGNAKYALLQAVLEMARRHMQEKLQREDAMNNPEETKRYINARLSCRPSEVFSCLFLDSRNRLIVCEELFQGTIDGASVHPRDVVRRSLFHNAAAVIFAHNHPSGVAEPSQADIRITERLRDALGLIDVRVLDHLIVGDGDTFSFAEQGLL
ncbi:MAG: DNA repair protein RadC [Gammaproteobacteria bacterium]